MRTHRGPDEQHTTFEHEEMLSAWARQTIKRDLCVNCNNSDNRLLMACRTAFCSRVVFAIGIGRGLSWKLDCSRIFNCGFERTRLARITGMIMLCLFFVHSWCPLYHCAVHISRSSDTALVVGEYYNIRCSSFSPHHMWIGLPFLEWCDSDDVNDWEVIPEIHICRRY